MAASPSLILCRRSFGFSGAGFLASYHLGAAKCLLDQGLLLQNKKDHHRNNNDDDDNNVMLLGVSGGALVSAAIAANVDPNDGMQAVLEISRRTRSFGGNLDVLSPGFSLVDLVEEFLAKLFRESVKDEDPEVFLKRIQGGSLLRIGLTDSRVFPPVGRNPRATLYVDRYRDMEDVIAACILSSYVPVVTGPMRGSLDAKNGAVARATLRMDDMIRAGCVKKASTGEPLQPPSTELGEAISSREICWDGGLVNAFPVFDSKTVIVSPLAADFGDNNSINPSIEYPIGEKPPSYLPLNSSVRVHLTTANALALRYIAMSSDDVILQGKFSQGYDNAHAFLDQNNLLTVFQSQSEARRGSVQ